MNSHFRSFCAKFIARQFRTTTSIKQMTYRSVRLYTEHNKVVLMRACHPLYYLSLSKVLTLNSDEGSETSKSDLEDDEM
ncbi:unnamed protein product [Blepharisma stoltei]|uniref:Uncharacterized protein n=1 Tax=Blepharisma stoltei TaxID=1481888 RepID=A0AAU9JAY8_9CILI|nr:unnamed protein product [Blepharisma stoltei]